MRPLHKRRDLSRWNRSGLGRFRYIDGNAITHLESLRLAMVDELVSGKSEDQWTALETAVPVADNETPGERQARWRKQYFDERRDYAWELLRSFARASHVLTEHLDAYANESFIGTATQWDNVRRLVEMLDYHPAPPASAETPMVLFAKEGKSGTVETGFAVKNKPKDGSKPSVFETLADLEVDAELNELRPAGWNKSQESFNYNPAGTTFPVSEPQQDIAAGTLGVLLIEQGGVVACGIQVEVSQVQDNQLILKGEDKPATCPASVLRHQVRLLLKPDYKKMPRLTGSNVAQLAASHGLGVDDVVAWNDGGWQAARVEEVDGNRVRFSRSAPAQGKSLYLAVKAEKQDIGGHNRVVLPSKAAGVRVENALWNSSLGLMIESYVGQQKDSTNTAVLYDYVSGSFVSVYYLLGGDARTSVLESQPQSLELDGDPGDFADGDWVIAGVGGARHAAYIERLEEGEKSFELELSTTLSDIDMLYGDFKIELRPDQYDANTMPAFETAAELRSDSACYIPLETIPDALTLGRELVVEGLDSALAVTVKEVDTANSRIKVAPGIPGSESGGSDSSTGFKRIDTRIYGNVVTAGHGESQPQKILGSGDASRAGQEFRLAVEEVSFIRDSSFANGVRAALEVVVDQRSWTQVATLNDSEAEDAHYCVRMNEDGTLNLQFGDGRHGRRLPTGSNNVRAGYRVGVGSVANLEAGSLVKEVKPHALIDSVLQPALASGGNEMEGVSSLRENAPASVLTLSRAVSLSDFTALAQANSSVWQAQAIRLPPGGGRSCIVEVVVVPAGGGALGSLQQDLANTLIQHALPGVKVSVTPYQSIILDLQVNIRVDSNAYDAEFVKEDVRNALASAFSLQNCKLGKALFMSQVIAVIESVEGVENCDCSINDSGFRDANGAVVTPRQVITGSGGVIKRVSIDERQVIYLDASLSQLTIEATNFSL